MMRLLRKLHKWLGLLIGLQVLVWLLSGLVISLLDPAKISGELWVRASTSAAPALGPGVLLEPAELPAAWFEDALSVDLTTRRGKPVYLVSRSDGELLIDATVGSIMTFGQAEAADLAQQDFSGAGDIVSVQRGMAPDMETRDSHGAYWRVDFSDPPNTAIYVSAASGKLLERRNDWWRVQDFFWMLHIMDYPGREDLNNPLVIAFALIAIWLGISGFLLLFGSFRRRDFFLPGYPGKTG